MLLLASAEWWCVNSISHPQLKKRTSPAILAEGTPYVNYNVRDDFGGGKCEILGLIVVSLDPCGDQGKTNED